MVGAGDGSTRQPRGKIDPPVRADCRAIHAQLRAAFRFESGKQNTAFIRPAISVGVLEKQDIRRAGHNDAASPREHSIREGESFGKRRALVHAPVTIRVLEQGNAPRRRLRCVRVATVLCNEHSASVVKSNRAGRFDEWLCCDEFDA
jgi:hypothetical protein